MPNMVEVDKDEFLETIDRIETKIKLVNEALKVAKNQLILIGGTDDDVQIQVLEIVEIAIKISS